MTYCLRKKKRSATNNKRSLCKVFRLLGSSKSLKVTGESSNELEVEVEMWTVTAVTFLFIFLLAENSTEEVRTETTV